MAIHPRASLLFRYMSPAQPQCGQSRDLYSSLWLTRAERAATRTGQARPDALDKVNGAAQSPRMTAAASRSIGETHEFVVVGGGLVGLSLGIACAQAGLDTLVVDREDPSVMLAESFDGRASAIAYGSQQVLSALGIWAKLASKAQPILEIRV